jgi:hypothetical protein
VIENASKEMWSRIERQAVGQLRGEYPYYYIIPLHEMQYSPNLQGRLILY